MAAIRNTDKNRKRWNLNTCVFVLIILIATILYFLARTVTALERSSSSREQHTSTYSSKIANTFGWLLSGQNEESTQIPQSFSSHLLQVLKEDLQEIYIFFVTWLCPLIPREITSGLAGIILLGFMLFSYVMSRKLSDRNNGNCDTALSNNIHYRTTLQRDDIRTRSLSGSDQQRSRIYTYLCKLTYRNIFWILVVLAFLGSLPWEFIRLYQTEIAKKMANLQVGVPDECIPKQVSILQSFRNWVYSILSWQPNPCERYYKMLMVDPLWEVSPIMVLSSTVTRCIIYPMEIVLEGAGRSLKLFFNEIPLHWQPLMFLAVVLMLMVTIIVLGGYRLHIPFLFKIEPKTPVVVNKNVVVYNKSPVKNSIDTPKIRQHKRRGQKPKGDKPDK
ncbi:uncharacterized protein LOC132543198 [Ylistrum balloti]|uniref:uncharacterized protein LOC132543198 n=1 Tax=Ylistrum balloti TaxID=509963 RepID=UPI002905F623|nr:uncharacterized protein LOC132543198 [Ylistrum balloti]